MGAFAGQTALLKQWPGTSMIHGRKIAGVVLILAFTCQSLMPPAAFGGDHLPKFLSRLKPPTERDHSVESLAKEIDYLQHHINIFGTIVAKQPDVWGQARLTKHRQEYEQVTLGYLTQFKESLQGYIRRSDQSFLGLALALNAGSQTTSRSTSSTTPAGGASSSTGGATGGGASSSAAPSTGGGGGGGGGGGAGGQAGTSNPAFMMINNPGGNLTSGSAITRTQPLTGLSDFSEFSLEPTEMLSQLSRYLNYLQEIRRVNEGDDTADSPGYALNLVRIPVSIIPGNKTHKGYGAEVTITATPYLSEELLPMTMRNLVINDVVDQLGLGLTKVLERSDVVKKIADANQQRDRMSNADMRKSLKSHLHAALALTAVPDQQSEPFKELGLIWSLCLYARDYLGGNGLLKDPQGEPRVLIEDEIVNLDQSERAQLRLGMEWIIDQMPRPRLYSGMLPFSGPNANYDQLIQVNQSYSTTRPRRSDLAFPPSQVADIFGPDQVFINLLKDAAPASEMMIDQKHRNLLDVEAWLRRELEAAFDFLSLEKHQHLWLHCSRELADRVQARARRPPARGTIPPPFSEDPAILAIRDQFFRELEATAPGANFTGTEALSWAIIVESALLNKRLLEDIEDIAAVKCCRNLPTGETWIDFYSPHPSPEAREIFKQYVTCRWPIHVFALDPVVDEQNIADQFSRRRELQLALAVGVAQGAVNASTAMQFMRRVETDLETISLNRTMVGFAHGPDTFGWRFYPRVQPPPTVGNGRAFLQTLTGRPTSGQDIQTRQLEPGMRECEAVVIMPSFVPYVTFDIRTNWFCLTHPGKVELTLHDTMKLSRIYEGVRQQAGCVQGQCKYRAGDVCHLTRVIQQLERQLPLQTMLVHVPYENTLGGFEMFATGVTDLGPEFKGFYGEPGVRVVNAASAQSGSATAPTSAAAAPMNAPANSVCGAVDLGMNVSGTTYQCQGTCGGTTLFLVGKNFSVHETKVVAGGRCVPFVLLSREIMRVTIPNDVDTVTDATKEEWVDVHLATPYGVTSHLAIPAIRPAAPAAASKAALGWDTTSFQCQICYWPLAAGGRPVAAGGQQLGVQALAYQKAPQKITATDSSDPVLRPRTACLQFRVSAQTGGTTPLLLGDTRPVPVVFDQQGKLSVDFQSAGGTGPGDLIKEVVMNRLDASQGATQIVADTYVNYDQPHSQGLPVVKFGKPLTIDIAVITCSTTNAVNLRQRPTPAGAGDRVPAEQPEEIPCENCPLPDLLPPGSTWGPPGPLPPPPPAPTTQSRSFRDMRPGRLAPRVVRLPPTD